MIRNNDYYKNSEYSDNYIKGEKITPDLYAKRFIETLQNGNRNILETTLELMWEYMSLPILINRKFEKFIKEFFDCQLKYRLKKIEYKGDGVYLVTVSIGHSRKLIKIVWVQKDYFSDKPISINIIKQLKKSIRKYRTFHGAIVTTGRLSNPALRAICQSKYDIFFIDKSLLEKTQMLCLKSKYQVNY